MEHFRASVFVLLLATLSVAAAGTDGITWTLIVRGQDPPANIIHARFQTLFGVDRPHYVGRIWADSAIIPATVSKYSKLFAYAAAASGEKTYHEVETFEVAVADPSAVRWVPATNSSVPEEAVPVGITADGKPLYACRVLDTNLVIGAQSFMMTVGTLNSDSEGCRCPFYGPQVYSTYEVLAVSGN